MKVCKVVIDVFVWAGVAGIALGLALMISLLVYLCAVIWVVGL